MQLDAKSYDLAIIKAHLHQQLDDWLGFDTPEEGSDDYLIWRSRLEEIEAIGTINEACLYLASLGFEYADILEFIADAKC